MNKMKKIKRRIYYNDKGAYILHNGRVYLNDVMVYGSTLVIDYQSYKFEIEYGMNDTLILIKENNL